MNSSIKIFINFINFLFFVYEADSYQPTYDAVALFREVVFEVEML